MLLPVICQGRTISHEALEWLRGWIGRMGIGVGSAWHGNCACCGIGAMAWGGEGFCGTQFLLKLAERELIELPPVRKYKRSGPQTVGWVKANFEHTPEPLCTESEQVRPVEARLVEAGSDPARRVAFHLIDTTIWDGT